MDIKRRLNSGPGRKLTRRDFLRATAAVSAGLVLQACAPPSAPSPAPTTAPAGGATTAPSAAACTKDYAKEYAGRVFRIGSMQPMTGPFAYYGKVMGGGILYAVKEINESGVLPFKMEVVVVDHKSGDNAAGLAGVRKLIDVDKVSFIVATWGNIVPIAQTAAAEVGIPVFNGGAQASELAGLPYMHNDILMVDQMIFPEIDYMVKQYGIKRPAIIHWTESEGIGARDSSAFYAEKIGLKVVAIEGHEPGKTDYRAELTRIKAANPDSLFLWSQGTDTGYVAKQAHEMGLNVPFCCYAELNPEAIAVAGNENLEGTLLASEYLDLNSQRPETQKFVKGYTAFAGEDPTNLVANYYDMGYIALEAAKNVMSKCGDPFEGKQLETAIQEIKIFPTVYGNGKLELLSSGCTLKQFGIWQFKKGKMELVGVFEAPPCGKYPEAKVS